MATLIRYILVLLLVPNLVNATVIFQDNFNTWTTGYTFVDGNPDPPSPWYSAVLTGVTLPATCNSVARPYEGGGGISASGGYGGSKGIEFPRCSSVSNNYYGLPGINISSIGNYSEIYIRFYVKFDSGFDKSIGEGFKFPLDRIIITDGSNEYNWYFGMRGESLSDAYMSLGADNGYFGGAGIHSPLAPHTAVYDDHAYHAVEFHIKLHPTTGRVRSWVDGTLQYDYNNVNTAPSTSYYFSYFNFGMGNVSDATWNNTTWKSAWLDELVIADAYVGPISGGDTTAPSTTISTSDPSSISSDSLTVSGSSSDAVGVSGCKWRIGSAPDSSNGTSCTGTTSFSCSTSGYSSGSNTLYVGCYDAAGNYGSDSITVNYTPSGGGITPGSLLFSESFENSTFTPEWYDGGSTDIVAGGQSGNCLRWVWSSGGSTPASMSTMRAHFTAQNKVLVRAYFKLDANWQGHQQSYGGPHIIHVMGDVDGDYDSLALSDLNTYIEFFTNVGSPYNTYTVFSFQDAERIVTSPTPPNNLVGSTETRAVAGCNGTLGDAGDITTCYQDGSWYNGRQFHNTVVNVPKNEWVQVDTYMEMNTISNNVANADGKMRQWVNGTLVKSSDTVVFRTGAQPTKKFDKIILAPFMGSSPIDQTMYIDELKVYDGYTEIAGPVSLGSVLLGR